MEQYKEGDKVEVCCREPGTWESYYAAIVVSQVGKDMYLVKYNTLKETDGSGRHLTEEVSGEHLRPEPHGTMAAVGVRRLDKVDAYYNNGWCVGTVVDIKEQGKIFTLYFDGTEQKIDFPIYCLRNHKEWINGDWVMDKNRVSAPSFHASVLTDK